MPRPSDTEDAYNYSVDQWCSLGWLLDDQGWHAPAGWKDLWGSPNEDFYPSAAEFARVRSEIDGI